MDSSSTIAVVEVFRDTPDDVQDRWVRVRIGNEPEEILRYGHSLRFPVEPGRHRLHAHNTLSRATLDLELEAGQTARVRCYNHFAKGGTLMMLTIGFAFITVRLERT